MQVEAVVGFDDSGGSALGGAGVAAHGVDFRDQGDAQLRVGFSEGDGGSQPRASRADDGNVGFNDLHYFGSSA